MMLFKIALVSWMAVVAIASTAEATITIVRNSLFAIADQSGVGDRKEFTAIAVPTAPDPFQLEAVHGDVYAKSTIDWSVVGGQTVLSFDTHQGRTGLPGSTSFLYQRQMQFLAHETTSYELTGFLHVADVGATEAGLVELSATLYDTDTGVYLFSGEQRSDNTHDEQCSLGELGGDESNSLRPGSSLTGSLVEGHTYFFQFYSAISASDPDSGASAMGNVTLKIGSVPEPSTLWLATICALFIRRIRRS
jgi:hypothetical protein